MLCILTMVEHFQSRQLVFDLTFFIVTFQPNINAAHCLLDVQHQKFHSGYVFILFKDYPKRQLGPRAPGDWQGLLLRTAKGNDG